MFSAELEIAQRPLRDQSQGLSSQLVLTQVGGEPSIGAWPAEDEPSASQRILRLEKPTESCPGRRRQGSDLAK